MEAGSIVAHRMPLARLRALVDSQIDRGSRSTVHQGTSFADLGWKRPPTT